MSVSLPLWLWGCDVGVLSFGKGRPLVASKTWRVDNFPKIAEAAQGWQETLETYDVNCLLLSRERQPALISAAAVSEGSCILYEGADAVLVMRKTVSG
jgi:hypothetical protein